MPHPASQVFPLMAEPELIELSEDIRKNGLLEPIVLFGAYVLDGRNRLAACELAGVEPRFIKAENVSSPTEWVVSKNLHRRHLSISQRAAIAAEIMPLLREEARERQRAAGGDKKSDEAKSVVMNSAQAILPNDSNEIRGKVRDIAGKTLGVAGCTIQHAINIKKADPEEFEKVKRGEISVEAARRKIEERSEPTKRKLMLENAAKRNVVEALSQVRGLCRGLAEMNVAGALAGFTTQEARQWAEIASESAKQLRALASKLRQENVSEVA